VTDKRRATGPRQWPFNWETTTVETMPRILPNRRVRRKLRASIDVWRNNLIDFHVEVDDKRRAVDQALDELRIAVAERDRAALHLAQLIGWRDELEGVASFGPQRSLLADDAGLRGLHS
jgi:hypothetical protein